jgi:hypothetical protein
VLAPTKGLGGAASERGVLQPVGDIGMMESPCFMGWPDMARRAVVLGLASMNLPRLCQARAMASQPVGTYIYIGSTSYRNLYLEHIEIIAANQLKFSWWIQIGKTIKKEENTIWTLKSCP